MLERQHLSLLEVDNFVPVLKPALLVKVALESIKVGLFVLGVLAFKAGLIAPGKQLLVLKTFIKLELSMLHRVIHLGPTTDLYFEISLELSPALSNAVDLDHGAILSPWLPTLGLHCGNRKESLALNKPRMRWIHRSLSD